MARWHRNPILAENLVSDVMIAALAAPEDRWENFPRGALRNWLRKTMKNIFNEACRRHIINQRTDRRKKKEKETGEELPVYLREVAMEACSLHDMRMCDAARTRSAFEDRVLLHEVFERLRAGLDEREFRIYVAAVVNDRPYAEIAKEMGMPVGSVGGYLSMARDKLPDILKDFMDEAELATMRASRLPRRPETAPRRRRPRKLQKNAGERLSR